MPHYFTPTPHTLCPFQPQSPPSALALVDAGKAPPEGVVCSSKCGAFLIVHDGQGQPMSGSCSLRIMAIGLANLEQRVQVLIALANAGTPAPAPAPGATTPN